MRSSSHARATRYRALAAAVAASCIIAPFAIASPAGAASPPVAPALIAPAHGSVAADSDPRLRVDLANPEGTPLTVSFEGRKKGATEPGIAEGDPFTLVAMPDIQNYTNPSRADMIRQQSQWIVDTRPSLNTQFVVQLGDLVGDWSFAGHWPYASNGLKVLDDNGVPNAVVPGNHDFDNTTGEHAGYDTWFPPSRYANANWTPTTARYGGYMGQDQFGDDPVDRGNMNNYSLFTAGGVDWLVLGLEWEAPAPVLEWADRVLAAFPDREVIMFTHAFVNLPGSRRTFAQRPGGTPPETTWQSFVRTHCQIRLVLNGHEHNGDLGEARRTDPNACGEPVHQILSNYQERANGGNGWLRYYRFDPAAETMTAVTYSPVLNQYETDATSAFTLPFAFAEPQPAGFTPIATVTTSGGEASATWMGLAPDTEYEWRVRVSDGTTTTTSDIWALKTRPDDVVFSDGFSRTLTNTWGTADSGQAWTSAAPANAFSVSDGAGRMVVPPGARRNAAPASTTVSEGSFLTSIATTPAVTGSGLYASLYARLGTVGDYRATLQFRSNGAPNLTLVRRVGSTETNIATYRMLATPGVGEPVHLRFELHGTSPTILRARAWMGSTEPSAWHVTATDSTGPQTAGGIGFTNYVSGGSTNPATVIVDRLVVTRLGAATPPANVPPVAAIQITSQSERTVNVSGAGSTDSDGTVTAWAWNFGDGTTATGPTASRTYTANGTYTITLTVTDDDGATHTTTRPVTVTATPPANVPPVAAIQITSQSERTVNVSGAGSTDSDGTVTAWAWNFGDGTTATGPTASRTYTANGTYTITLTVTDDDGATHTTTRPVTVTATPPANVPPVAAIQITSQSERTVNVSGAGSTDSDGTVTAWAWNFGDGTTATGPTASRTYTANGTYTITLTVTDDDGATHTTTRPVTVTATPPANVLAADAFARTATNSWGAADVGGPWTTSGTSSMYSVVNGAARHSITTKGLTALSSLGSVSARDGVLRVDASWSRMPAQGAIYAAASPRSVNATNDYRCSVYIGSSGKPKVDIVRKSGGVDTTLAYVSLSALTFAVDTEYTLMCRAQTVGGATQVSAKFFPAGSAEPATWQVTASDSTPALQANGKVLLWSYMSSSATAPIVTTWDDLQLEALAP